MLSQCCWCSVDCALGHCLSLEQHFYSSMSWTIYLGRETQPHLGITVINWATTSLLGWVCVFINVQVIQIGIGNSHIIFQALVIFQNATISFHIASREISINWAESQCVKILDNLVPREQILKFNIQLSWLGGDVTMKLSINQSINQSNFSSAAWREIAQTFFRFRLLFRLQIDDNNSWPQVIKLSGLLQTMIG